MATSDDLLEWAKTCLSNAQVECDYRATTSRAYYALYHAIVDHLNIDVDARPNGVGSHEHVENELRRINKRKDPAIFSRQHLDEVRRMKQNRVLADYYLNQKCGELTAQDTVQHVVDLIDRVRRISNA